MLKNIAIKIKRIILKEEEILMKLKKLCALCSAMVMAAGMSVSSFASARKYEEGAVPEKGNLSDSPAYLAYFGDKCVEGAVPNNPEDEKNFCEDIYYSDEELAKIPASADNSATVYFPEIMDQGASPSCSAVATAYYQYSYEVNRLNKITSKSQQTLYSPKWTFNFTNYGKQHGSNLLDNYKILSNYGCLKLDDLPYVGEYEDYDDVPADMIAEKSEALKTRVSDVYTAKVNGLYAITDPKSTYIAKVKKLLSEGKVLTASSYDRFDSKVVNGECIVYRCAEEEDTGHSLTIVGYDDNKWVDINGDGVKQTAETGAFKVANSWGKSFDAYGYSSNDGFFWVAYDALNKQSAVSGNWESKLIGTRVPAFAFGSSKITNKFYCIEVEHKDVGYIGKMYMYTADRNSVELGICSTSDSVTSWDSNTGIGMYLFNNDEEIQKSVPFEGYILFDFAELAEPVKYYLKGYNWYARITNGTTTPAANFQIIDDMGRAVTPVKTMNRLSDNSRMAYHNIHLSLGDMDYDGSLTKNDYTLMFDYVAGKTDDLSTLQKAVGDFDRDGSITLLDVVAFAKLLDDMGIDVNETVNTNPEEGAVPNNPEDERIFSWYNYCSGDEIPVEESYTMGDIVFRKVS